MDITTILTRKYSGCLWTLNGDEYSGLDWQDDSKKPTEAELEALWPTVQAETARASVEQERAQAYRETSDPIFFEWQRGDATEAEWLSAVQAVKAAHPYPEAP
jgi:hypothetical protein